jgi:hypothetical protein
VLPRASPPPAMGRTEKLMAAQPWLLFARGPLLEAVDGKVTVHQDAWPRLAKKW